MTPIKRGTAEMIPLLTSSPEIIIMAKSEGITTFTQRSTARETASDTVSVANMQNAKAHTAAAVFMPFRAFSIKFLIIITLLIILL